eukprot:14290314-Alexandrium_andersonii.AAC.1
MPVDVKSGLCTEGPRHGAATAWFKVMHSDASRCKSNADRPERLVCSGRPHSNTAVLLRQCMPARAMDVKTTSERWRPQTLSASSGSETSGECAIEKAEFVFWGAK